MTVNIIQVASKLFKQIQWLSVARILLIGVVSLFLSLLFSLDFKVGLLIQSLAKFLLDLVEGANTEDPF